MKGKHSKLKGGRIEFKCSNHKHASGLRSSAKSLRLEYKVQWYAVYKRRCKSKGKLGVKINQEDINPKKT